MRSNYRRILDLLHRPRRWPVTAVVPLIVFFVAAAVVVVWFAMTVRPNEFPPTRTADQWAAEAAVFGAGALFFAVVATVIATIAFINSTEKPILSLIYVAYAGRDKADPVAVTSLVEPKGSDVASAPWWLDLQIHNDGPIAARFVAIRVKVETENAYFDPTGGIEPWQERRSESGEAPELWWEGGANAVVHPHWSYHVPGLNLIELRLTLPVQPTYKFRVDVVADDVLAFGKTYTIHARQSTRT